MGQPFTPPVLPFFLMAFAWSWLFWLPLTLVSLRSPTLASALAIAGGFGPGVAAIAMVGSRDGSLGMHRWLTRCLRWRHRWPWMVAAFFIPVTFMGLAATAHVALGGTLPRSPAAGHLLLAVVNFPLVFLIGGPLGEEFGWRGYALPLMQERMGWRAASLVLGSAWAIWHLPLFFIVGTAQSQVPAGLFFLSTIASSVMFAWLLNRSHGSLLPCLVLHTAVNAWSSVIPIMVKPDGSNLRPCQFVVGLLVVVAVALLFTGGPHRQRHRVNYGP